jgi:hypothetical protein
VRSLRAASRLSIRTARHVDATVSDPINDGNPDRPGNAAPVTELNLTTTYKYYWGITAKDAAGNTISRLSYDDTTLRVALARFEAKQQWL